MFTPKNHANLYTMCTMMAAFAYYNGFDLFLIASIAALYTFLRLRVIFKNRKQNTICQTFLLNF